MDGKNRATTSLATEVQERATKLRATLHFLVKTNSPHPADEASEYGVRCCGASVQLNGAMHVCTHDRCSMGNVGCVGVIQDRAGMKAHGMAHVQDSSAGRKHGCGCTQHGSRGSRTIDAKCQKRRRERIDGWGESQGEAVPMDRGNFETV